MYTVACLLRSTMYESESPYLDLDGASTDLHLNTQIYMVHIYMQIHMYTYSYCIIYIYVYN